jgi:hypothetical protein
MKLKKQLLKQFQLLFILFTVSDCQHYNNLVSRMVPVRAPDNFQVLRVITPYF